MIIKTVITCDTSALAQAAADTLSQASGSASLVSNFNTQAANAGISVSASDASSTASVALTPNSDSSSMVEWWIIMLVIVVPLVMLAAIGVVIWKIRSATHDTAGMAPQEAHKTQEIADTTQEIPDIDAVEQQL